MAEENILAAGLAECRELLGYLEEQNDVKAKAANSSAAVVQSEKAIKAKEKAITDEITATLKKRTDEIEASFDKELSALKGRSKRVKAEKGKTKSEKVAKRIDVETEELREKDRELHLETRTVFKRDGVSKAFNTKLYFALFYPKCFTDYVILIIAVLISLVAVPCGLFFFALPEAWKGYPGFILVYFVCAVVFVGLYLLINHFTKEKHRSTYQEVRQLRADIRANRRSIAYLRRKIRHDRDESAYELNEYDEEMQGLSGEMSELLESKKSALKDFEKTVKPVLTEDIREKNRAELEELKNYKITATEDQKAAETRSKELGLLIVKKYEPYLGKDKLNVTTIGNLVALMDSGSAQTIGEAIEQMKISPAESAVAEPKAPEQQAESQHASVAASEQQAESQHASVAAPEQQTESQAAGQPESSASVFAETVTDAGINPVGETHDDSETGCL